MFVSPDQLIESEKRYHSFKKPPVKVAKTQTVLPATASIEKEKTDTSEAQDKLMKRRQMLQKVSSEPIDFAFERAIGNNNSVYSNFCELITYAKQKVCRIVVKDGTRNSGYATGFMVSERLVLTNWHVFPNMADAADSEVEFNYEYDINGRETSPAIFKLAVQDFYSSNQALDYCFVAVCPTDVTGKIPLSKFGYLYLNPATGKVGAEGTELLNIIHHPAGDYKQLSIRENRFTKLLENTIWYETDTAPGSSGSPVFNDQWQVVALHHMGVPSKTADGKNYLDIKGKIIEPVNGKIDIARICWLANEGIRISVLLDDINSKFPNSPFVKGLTDFSISSPVVVPAGGDKDADNDKTHVVKTGENNNENVQVIFPASLLTTDVRFSVTFQNKPVTPDGNSSIQLPVAGTIPIDLLDEIAKVDREKAVDYSTCKGYLPGFLGIKIPLPGPLAALRKYVARHIDSDSYVFKYFHFSVIFHAIRKMPIISAININGDMQQRTDQAQRVDIWLRDKRLDTNLQLNDNYYALSGFDRGHLSRREDADWADTAELAKQYADLTCVYTNACPQVPKLNRSTSGGLWGKLEKVILEQGAVLEAGKSLKISVMNGPIFLESDPVFRGVQVPLQFWKIILWYNAAGKLRATAFKLSQETLVDDITFEELNFDGNADFKQYQCSIQSLQKLTQLNFSHLIPHDTFVAVAANESLEIGSLEEVQALVQKIHSS